MKTIKIVKIGGNVIDDEHELGNFLSGFSNLDGPKILVHGGGKLATEFAKKLNVNVNMINGRRITDKPNLEVIIMVYAGSINKKIVAQLQKEGSNALGFTGADGNCIISVKRPVGEVDFGWVGDVIKVNTAIIDQLLKLGVVPVFCAITHDENGQLLNTNADTIASELAVAFSQIYKSELYYCFEKNGVLKDMNDDDSVIKTIDNASFNHLIDQGIITEGMLPKLENCFHAINRNVKKVCIGKPEMLFKKDSLYTTLH